MSIGDIMINTARGWRRLPVGPDGQPIVGDSTQALGANYLTNSAVILSGRTAADVTNATQTMATVTGLDLPVRASKVYIAEWKLYVAGAVSGVNFQLVGPASPTNVLIFTQGDTTGVTIISTDAQTAFGSPTQAYVAGAFSGFVSIHACVEVGLTAGQIHLQFACAGAAQSVSIKRGSFLRGSLVA